MQRKKDRCKDKQELKLKLELANREERKKRELVDKIEREANYWYELVILEP